MNDEPYDINFCFPVPALLESERVALTPFIPSKHAETFIAQALPHPEIFKYLPFGPYKDTADFCTNLIDARVSPNPGYILFAIYDKTRPAVTADERGVFAGIVGLINSSAPNLATEIGCIMILPAFQRTHVASNAVGILLHFALDAAPSGGIGLRRVVWQANERNAPSVRLAQRMGFVLEGILRWDRVLPAHKTNAGNGLPLRQGDPREGYVGRDTTVLSLTWDRWVEEWREKVDVIMARTN